MAQIKLETFCNYVLLKIAITLIYALNRITFSKPFFYFN